MYVPALDIFISQILILSLIIFNIYLNIHQYSQLYYNLIRKQFDDTLLQYDYIIIGSGTAGSIIASRLAQQKNNNVLLLEAGQYSNFLFDIPILTPILQKTQLDWQYATKSQKFACKAMENQTSHWPMGKIFGGSHALNNMLYVRGHEEDFKQWFTNKTNYNYESDILYYFKKLENWLSSQNDNLMHLNELEYVSPLAEAVLRGITYLGLTVKTTNNEVKIGFMKPYVTTKNNKRWTTSHSLLEKKYKNLKILVNAVVTKIVLKNNYDAVAVQFSFLGQRRFIKARKGIILSAGVIGTPKILLHSGIGPSEHLNKIKIRLRKNLPVGENLMDHVTTGLDLIILNQTLPVSLERLFSPISAYNYFINGKGPWTVVGCEAIGFYHTNSTDENIQPNLEFMALPFGISSDKGKHFRYLIGLEKDTYKKYFSKLITKQVVSILPVVLHPKSRGYVRLQNSDPNIPPIIDPNYLSNQNDVDLIVDGIQFIKKLLKTKPMQKLGAILNEQPFPGCENHHFDSKSYWECYIRHLTLTSYHPVGTCKMGDPNHLESVVDYNFKVIGTNKLFVVDASIFPSLISGNPNAAIGMMAERAVDVLKFEQFLLKGHSTKLQFFLNNYVSYF